MKKIAAMVVSLFSIVCCVAQPVHKPVNPSSTDCPTFNNKTTSKAGYFQFLKSKPKKNQQPTVYIPNNSQKKSAESQSVLNPEVFHKSALPDYSTLEKPTENKTNQKERRKQLFKEKPKADPETVKTVTVAESAVIVSKAESTEKKITRKERRKRLIENKPKADPKIAQTSPLTEPVANANTEKTIATTETTNDTADKIADKSTLKKDFKLKKRIKAPSPKKQKRASRRKSAKCPQF